MRTFIKLNGGFLPDTVSATVINIINQTLNNIVTIEGKFIVNDTLFFRKQRNSNVSPCVMNSANYISKKFQHELSLFDGCQGETKINNQAFDGLIHVNYSGVGYKINDKNRLLEIIHEYISINDLPSSSVYTLFPMFYGMYVERDFYDITPLEFAKDHFIRTNIEKCFNIGVEFETGNVASSFRAINKLNTLYQDGVIDCGCFITSNDKSNGATRIWPVSNRNGSFQELEQRHYKDQISLPLIAIGFSPDEFRSNVPFLSKNGTLYSPEDTQTTDISGKYRRYLGEDHEELLLPNC